MSTRRDRAAFVCFGALVASCGGSTSNSGSGTGGLASVGGLSTSNPTGGANASGITGGATGVVGGGGLSALAGGAVTSGGRGDVGGSSDTPSGGAGTTGGAETGGATSVAGATNGSGGLVSGGANPTGGTITAGGAMTTGGATTTGGTAGAPPTGGAYTGGVGATAPVLATGGMNPIGGAGGTLAATGGTPPIGGSAVCSRQCQWQEPTIMPPACSSGACTASCGDGLVFGSEECDDGNTADGDGCSSTCAVEPGFACSQSPLSDEIFIPMVVRDFDAGGDFEPGGAFSTGIGYATQGLVQEKLDATSQKPALASTTGTYNGVAGRASAITSAASFAQWFSDDATGPNTRHAKVDALLPLYKISGSNPAVYVNRYGNGGDGLTNTQYRLTHTGTCGSLDMSNHDAAGNPIPCTACYFNANCPSTDLHCALPCTQNDTTPCQTDPTYTGQCDLQGNSYIGTFLDAAFDGNPLFFPADDAPAPFSPSAKGQIEGYYNPSWPTTTSDHNFSFTTEVRYWFKYDASRSYKLTFVAGTDMWVFVNGTLAIDLGGIHTAVQGAITFGNGATTSTSVLALDVIPTPSPIVSHPSLGLTDGSMVEIAVFHANRQTKESSYQVMLVGFDASRSICLPVCTGGNSTTCQDACNPAITDCYNQCTTTCILGPYCGDGIVQSAHEQCDPGPAMNG